MVGISITYSLLEHHYNSIPSFTANSKKCSLILGSLCKDMNIDIVEVLETKKIKQSIQRFLKSRCIRSKWKNQKEGENEDWLETICFVLSTRKEAVVDDRDVGEQEPHAGGRPKKRLR